MTFTLPETWGGINRDEAIATAKPFLRARLYMARLQDVIDYGAGDVRRAAEVQARIQSAVDHAIEQGEWYAAALGRPTLLAGTLHEWSAAVDGVCWRLEHSERVA